MPAPKTSEEALARANNLTREKYLLRLASNGSAELTKLSKDSLKEHQDMRALAAPDLIGVEETIELAEYSEDEFVTNIGKLLSSTSGLSQLSLLRKTLIYISSNTEWVNVWHTLQVLAWLKPAEEQKAFGNRMLIALSKMEQLPAVIARSVRTPAKYWSTESKELFDIAGGLSLLRADFSGTPVGMLFQVAERSLVDSLNLYGQSKKMGRLKEDARFEAAMFCRKTELASHIGASDLDSYNRAENAYQTFSRELQSLQSASEPERLSADYMKRLERLTRANSRAQERYQRFQKKVETNPGVIQNALGSLRETLQIADSYAANEIRLLELAAQSRRNALMRVNQAILLISNMAKANSDFVLLTNRLMQEKVIADYAKLFKEISDGQFEDGLAIVDAEMKEEVNE